MCLVCIIVRLFCSRVCRERALMSEHAIRTPSGNLFVLVKCWTGTCAWFLWGQNSSSEFSSEHRGWHLSSCAVNSSLSEKNGIFCLPCVYYHTAAAAPERWPLAPHPNIYVFIPTTPSLVLWGSLPAKICSPQPSVWCRPRQTPRIARQRVKDA